MRRTGVCIVMVLLGFPVLVRGQAASYQSPQLSNQATI